MKKVFCFSLIVMFLALAGLTPVRADDVSVVTPYVDTPTLTQSEIDQYTYSTMLMEYLRMGGTIDVQNKSDNYSALDLLEDFGGFVKDVIGDVVDVINPFQSEFQWGKGYPLNKATPAMLQLMGLLPFYAISSSDDPTIDIPDDYLPYIQKINDVINTGFFWKNYTYTETSGVYPASVPVPNTLTFYNYQSWWNTSNRNIGDIFNGTGSLNVSSILTINISLQDNQKYLCNISGYNPNVSAGKTPNNAYYITYEAYSTFFKGVPSSINDYTFNNSYRLNTLNYEFDTLTECFTALSMHFRNINIYVDGVPWSIVSEPTSYNIELSTSTVTPSGERVRWMYDKEIYVDMDKIVEKLDDILDSIDNIPNTPTIIKFDDLDDVIVDVDGQPAIAVKVLLDDRNIDELYLSTYGPIIPAFIPLFTPVIDDVDIITIADTAVSPIPSDLLEVFGYMFMGVLFVGFIHRLLE